MENLSAYYQKIIKEIGENEQREGLIETPDRAAKAMSYLTRGYNDNLKSIVNNAIFSSDINEMVIIKDIEFYSLCEHHLLPFFGKCHIGYLPRGKVLGLSKFARIVDMYACRLQIQENMTKQIADAIVDVTQAKGVGVIVESQHLCMLMRGIKKQSSSMTSSVMSGIMKENPSTRAEFLQLIR